jgi:hypothetical protein
VVDLRDELEERLPSAAAPASVVPVSDGKISPKDLSKAATIIRNTPAE